MLFIKGFDITHSGKPNARRNNSFYGDDLRLNRKKQNPKWTVVYNRRGAMYEWEQDNVSPNKIAG